VEYTDLVKRYTQIFVKSSIQIQRSGGHNCSPLEYINLVNWSTKIQRSRVHYSSKVEYRNLAVEQLWPDRKNKLKSRKTQNYYGITKRHPFNRNKRHSDVSMPATIFG